jgi:hypothetical protein
MNRGKSADVHNILKSFDAMGVDAKKLRWAGGAQRLVWRVSEPKKAGALSARERTRGLNPLVEDKRTKSDVFVSFVKVSKVN